MLGLLIDSQAFRPTSGYVDHGERIELLISCCFTAMGHQVHFC